MPRGAPSQEFCFFFLHKNNVSIDDLCSAVFAPQLRLGCLSNAGWAKEKDAFSLEINKRAVELDDMTLNSVGVESLKQEDFRLFLRFFVDSDLFPVLVSQQITLIVKN